MQLRLPLFGDSNSSGLLKPTTLSEEVRELAFTPEELEAMRLADEEIERDFRWTNEELEASRKRDRESIFDRKDVAAQKVAAQKKAWYEANREKVATQQKAWYEANREKVAAKKKAYYEANREKINEKRRRKYREKRIRNQDGV